MTNTAESESRKETKSSLIRIQEFDASKLPREEEVSIPRQSRGMLTQNASSLHLYAIALIQTTR